MSCRAALQHIEVMERAGAPSGGVLAGAAQPGPAPGADGVAFADSMTAAAVWAAGSGGALPQPQPAALSRPEEQLAWAVAWQLLRQLAPLLPDAAAVAAVSEAVGGAATAAAHEAARRSPAPNASITLLSLLLSQTRTLVDLAQLQLRHFWAIGGGGGGSSSAAGGSSSGGSSSSMSLEQACGGVPACAVATEAVARMDPNGTRPCASFLQQVVKRMQVSQ